MALSVCACSAYADGSKYGDGEKYCSSLSTRARYFLAQDVLCHFLSMRLAGTGKFILDAIKPLVLRRKVKPFLYQVDVDNASGLHISIRLTGSGCLVLNDLRPVARIKPGKPII